MSTEMKMPELNFDSFIYGDDYKTNLSTKMLLYATNGNTIDFQKLLNENGSSLCFDVTDKSGWTPLIHAAFKGYSEIFKLIFKHLLNQIAKEIVNNKNENINNNDDNNINNNGNCLEQQLNHRVSWNGSTALHLACAKGHNDIIQMILDSGYCDINATDYDGATALHCAVLGRHYKACEMLLEHGIDLNKKDIQSKTAINWATDRQQTNIVLLLKSFKNKTYSNNGNNNHGNNNHGNNNQGNNKHGNNNNGNNNHGNNANGTVHHSNMHHDNGYQTQNHYNNVEYNNHNNNMGYHNQYNNNLYINTQYNNHNNYYNQQQQQQQQQQQHHNHSHHNNNGNNNYNHNNLNNNINNNINNNHGQYPYIYGNNNGNNNVHLHQNTNQYNNGNNYYDSYAQQQIQYNMQPCTQNTVIINKVLKQDQQTIQTTNATNNNNTDDVQFNDNIDYMISKDIHLIEDDNSVLPPLPSKYMSNNCNKSHSVPNMKINEKNNINKYEQIIDRLRFEKKYLKIQLKKFYDLNVLHQSLLKQEKEWKNKEKQYIFDLDTKQNEISELRHHIRQLQMQASNKGDKYQVYQPNSKYVSKLDDYKNGSNYYSNNIDNDNGYIPEKKILEEIIIEPNNKKYNKSSNNNNCNNINQHWKTINTARSDANMNNINNNINNNNIHHNSNNISLNNSDNIILNSSTELKESIESSPTPMSFVNDNNNYYDSYTTNNNNNNNLMHTNLNNDHNNNNALYYTNNIVNDSECSIISKSKKSKNDKLNNKNKQQRRKVGKLRAKHYNNYKNTIWERKERKWNN